MKKALENAKDCATSKRVPVLIDANTYAALKAYSEITGVPIARVAREAISDWMGTVGAARLEHIQGENKNDNLLHMPTRETLEDSLPENAPC